MSYSFAHSVEELLPRARWLAAQAEMLDKNVQCFAPGWNGYGGTTEGDRVLMVTDTGHDVAITQAIAIALRERGALVDTVTMDLGPDRELREDDEIGAMIRREPWNDNPAYVPRRYNDVPWATELCQKHGYDLLIQGRAYPNNIPCRWQGHPWAQIEQFLSDANVFPRDLHMLINSKAWVPIWTGQGCRVRITDPEGTDFAYTLFPDYWHTKDAWFESTPCWNHLNYHPGPPIVPEADAAGIVAGTLAHFSCPFPLIQLTLEGGQVQRVEGGGQYGEGWRELLEETRQAQYRQFPRPGMFWFWECALGTNPKVQRPAKTATVATGGLEWERFRAGLLHLGFGTAGPSAAEHEAGERGLPYGHLHVHLQFPTIDITYADGTQARTVDRGRLLALDDPDVRTAAAAYGDPDDVLDELWIPPIPGISMPGSLEEYHRDPKRWVAAGSGDRGFDSPARESAGR